MIGIVDYGLGNVQAFLNVYKRLNIPARPVATSSELGEVDSIILPGVGAFDHAMERLEASGMRERLEERVLGDRCPVLGVCVGMQILARSSDEGVRPGLGWIGGTVRAFAARTIEGLSVPHMGWNDVSPASKNPLFKELEADGKFYFLHSYYFACDSEHDVAATADYGAGFTAAVSAGNVHGVQFHPEKSHHYGIRLLKNFAEV